MTDETRAPLPELGALPMVEPDADLRRAAAKAAEREGTPVIRNCAAGHSSLNAANWSCPWCLLAEHRDNGRRLMESADGWKAEAERLRGIERALERANEEIAARSATQPRKPIHDKDERFAIEYQPEPPRSTRQARSDA